MEVKINNEEYATHQIVLKEYISRTACLLDDYVYNIGYGQSEYKTGLEL